MITRIADLSTIGDNFLSRLSAILSLKNESQSHQRLIDFKIWAMFQKKIQALGTSKNVVFCSVYIFESFVTMHLCRVDRKHTIFCKIGLISLMAVLKTQYALEATQE